MFLYLIQKKNIIIKKFGISEDKILHIPILRHLNKAG